MDTPVRTLVMLDGDLPGLLAFASASEEAALDGRAGRDGRSGDEGGVVCVFDASVVGNHDASGQARLAAAKAQAGAFGGLLVRPAWAPDTATLSQGLAMSAALLSAIAEAERRGIGRVVWPIWPGDEASLDAIGAAIDRAELSARIANLSRPASAAEGLSIETPYVDLSRAQMADLAVDLAAPVVECWWARHASLADAADAAAARQAWETALTDAGWPGALTAV